MKRFNLISALVLGITLSFSSGLHAGVHLATGYLYNLSSIKGGQSTESPGHKGFGYVGEAGYAFNLPAVRFIPFVSIGQSTLKASGGDEVVRASVIDSGKDYKMGRLGYGMRIDIISLLYIKGGGTVNSITENPAPADNYHINGSGYFAEGGMAFNLIPFVSFTAGLRYEKVVYKKYTTNSDEGDIASGQVKQTNMAAIVTLGLRI